VIATSFSQKIKFIGGLTVALAVGLFVWNVTSAKKTDGVLESFGQVTAEQLAATGLIDQDHQPMAAESLTGRVWLVNFFFTSCTGPCPLMTSKMAVVMQKFPQLNALSITSDPETDTPEVMKAYAAKFNADLSRWHFARGEDDKVQNFAVKVLKLPLGEEPDSHSARIALIDGRGRLVGWYDSQDSDGINRLSADIAASL
jgi:protein SCO1/2